MKKILALFTILILMPTASQAFDCSASWSWENDGICPTYTGGDDEILDVYTQSPNDGTYTYPQISTESLVYAGLSACAPNGDPDIRCIVGSIINYLNGAKFRADSADNALDARIDVLEGAPGGFAPSGLITEYIRGNGTYATLNAAAVGLGNVNNTSDANKPISTAVQTALDLKQAADTDLDYLASVTLSSNVKSILTSANYAAIKSLLSIVAADISDFASTVRSTVLTGLSTSTNSAISATDTSLAAFGKLQAQLNSIVSDTANKVVAYIGGTQKTGVRVIAKSGTVASGNLVIHLTADQTSGGTSLCPNGNVYLDSMMVRADNEVDTPFSYGQPALSNSNKTITIAVKKAANITTLPIIGALTGALLGAPVAANGAVVKALVLCD